MYPTETHILIRLQNLFYNKGVNRNPKNIYGRDSKYHADKGTMGFLTFYESQIDTDEEDDADYEVHYEENGKPVIKKIE